MTAINKAAPQAGNRNRAYHIARKGAKRMPANNKGHSADSRSILHGDPLDVIDHQHFDGYLPPFQLQPKLLGKRQFQNRNRIERRLALGSLLALIRDKVGQIEFEVVAALE